MARAADQFRQSDVTAWALIALVSGALAVLGANVAALVPPSLFSALHSSRADAATLAQLHGEIMGQQAALARLRQDNAALAARFSLAEQRGGETLRRVGALEVSIPDLLEIIPDNAPIDRSALTASIGEPAEEMFDVFGGTMAVRRSPLEGQSAQSLRVAVPAQPMPPAIPAEAEEPAAESDVATVPELDPDALAHAIALGPTVTPDGADAAWSDLAAKVGTLLIGLAPRYDGTLEGGRLVVGPLASPAAANALCQRLLPVGIACTPTRYGGEPLLSAGNAG